MSLCRLCGYRGSNDKTCVQPICCPICGEAYDDERVTERRQDNEDVRGLRLTKASAGRMWCGKSPQKSQTGGKPIEKSNSTEGVRTSTYLNLDLQSLLQLIPEQQHRKKRAEDDVVLRAVSGGLTPTRAEDPDCVYIRPRVDPTMRVLKVRAACVLVLLITYWGGVTSLRDAALTVQRPYDFTFKRTQYIFSNLL